MNNDAIDTLCLENNIDSERLGFLEEMLYEDESYIRDINDPFCFLFLVGMLNKD